MCPKHRTTVYLDQELVMIAKARKINISETIENVLRSMIGELDPEERLKTLRDEIAAIEATNAEKASGPLAMEIKSLKEAFQGREKQSEGMNENWMRMRIKDFPRIRARFSIEEAIDLATEG